MDDRIKLGLIGYLGFFIGSFFGGFIAGALNIFDEPSGLMVILIAAVIGLTIALSILGYKGTKLAGAVGLFVFAIIAIRMSMFFIAPSLAVSLVAELVGAMIAGWIVPILIGDMPNLGIPNQAPQGRPDIPQVRPETNPTNSAPERTDINPHDVS